MTQTTQPCSWASLNKAGKNLTINEPETEDNRNLLLSVFDSLNKLCERLSSIDYVLNRKKIEQKSVLDGLNKLCERISSLDYVLKRINIEQINNKNKEEEY